MIKSLGFGENVPSQKPLHLHSKQDLGDNLVFICRKSSETQGAQVPSKVSRAGNPQGAGLLSCLLFFVFCF